jgi:hypothetical protein
MPLLRSLFHTHGWRKAHREKVLKISFHTVLIVPQGVRVAAPMRIGSDTFHSFAMLNCSICFTALEDGKAPLPHSIFLPCGPCPRGGPASSMCFTPFCYTHTPSDRHTSHHSSASVPHAQAPPSPTPSPVGRPSPPPHDATCPPHTRPRVYGSFPARKNAPRS